MAKVMDLEVHRIMWRGIDIELVYVPKRWNVIASLEIRSINPPKAPLPIAETGYRSHFHPIGAVEACGGDVTAMVRDWLDEESKKPEWIEYEESRKQMDLFDF